MNRRLLMIVEFLYFLTFKEFRFVLNNITLTFLLIDV